MTQGDEWGTPPDIFEPLNIEFEFVCDLAATSTNNLLKNFISPEEDSLSVDWLARLDGGWGFLNPPFSRGNIDQFMAKVRAEAYRGAKIVTLTKLDSTEWFIGNILGYAREIRMPFPRVTFVGAENSYPWPVAVSIYDGKKHRSPKFKVWKWRK